MKTFYYRSIFHEQAIDDKIGFQKVSPYIVYYFDIPVILRCEFVDGFYDNSDGGVSCGKCIGSPHSDCAIRVGFEVGHVVE